MNKILVIDYEKCTGCRSCEMACSVFHAHVNNPAKSAVRVTKQVGEGVSVPVVCQQCEEPACAAICPVQAISRESTTNAMIVDNDLCVGCRMCVVACPFGAIALDGDRQRAFKCDLCGGAEPWCVRYCETGALTYKSPAAVSLHKKRVAAGRLLDVLEVRRPGGKGSRGRS
jgi:carbon-monoxide dehydrogenase iron sulfur subunit